MRRGGHGWAFIDQTALGINGWRSYATALLRIALYPLLLAVVLGAVAGLSGSDIGPAAPLGVVLEYGPIVLAGLLVLYAVARVHRRPWRSVVSADLRIDGRRLAIGAGVELAILTAQLALTLALVGLSWHLVLSVAWPVFVLALLLIPLQAASEELLFRGYLTQAIGRAVRSRVVIALLVALVFGLLHLNTHGALTVPYFIVVSLIFSLVSLRDDRLELTIGGHTAMNLFAFVLAGSLQLAPGQIGGGDAALVLTWASLGVLLVNGALFYGLTRLLVHWFCRQAIG